MGKGNVSVSGPYEGLFYIDNGDYHVYRRSDDPGEHPEVRLLRDLSVADLSGEGWLYDDEGIWNELEDIEECFKDDFTRMFPSFHAAGSLPESWIRNGRYGDFSRRVILESNLFYICMEDNEWSMAIELIQKEDPYDDHLSGLQSGHHQRYLDGMKTCLLERLPGIGTYAGPWTSGRIEKEKAV